MMLSQEADGRAALATEPPHRDAPRTEVSHTHRAWPYTSPEPGGGFASRTAHDTRSGRVRAVQETPRSVAAPPCPGANREALRDATSRRRSRKFLRRIRMACVPASRTTRQ